MNYENRCNDIDRLKAKLDTYRPFSADVLQQLKQYYKISLTYTSNAIEGNTLTESETKVIIEDGITIGGHPVREIQETLGHSKAYDFIYTLLNNEKLTENDILTIHKIFYEQINPEYAGNYRDKKVIITGTSYEPPAPSEIPDLMRMFINEIPYKQTELHPVKFAAWVHLQLVNIHPFIDGNGRCARLLTNLMLMKSGYAVIIIPPILRADYIEALKKAQTAKSPNLFYNFISEMVLQSLQDYSRIVQHISG